VSKSDERLPETFAEIRDGFLEAVWEQRSSLKGVALVNALNALAKLAELNRDADEAKGQPEPTVADVIDGIDGLSTVSRLRILATTLGDLDAEYADVRRVAEKYGASEELLRGAVAEAEKLSSPRGFEWNRFLEAAITEVLDAAA
jgi:hypothetical protein